LISCQLFGAFPDRINPTPTDQHQATSKDTPALKTIEAPVPSQIPTNSIAPGDINDLTNTHWVGRIYDQENDLKFEVFEIIFLPDGKFRYFIPNDWHENGTWQKNGNDIVLEWANHACDFYGLLNGDTIAGAQTCVDTGTKGWWVKLKTP